MTLIMATILQKPNMGLASHGDGQKRLSLGTHAAGSLKWTIKSDVG